MGYGVIFDEAIRGLRPKPVFCYNKFDISALLLICLT